MESLIDDLSSIVLDNISSRLLLPRPAWSSESWWKG